MLSLFLLALGWIGFQWHADAATYGLDKMDALTPYLNGKFPPVTPASNDLYGVENAFPSIVFDQPMFLMPYPNSNKLMMVRKPGTILRFENRADVTSADTEVFLDISDHVYTSSDSGMTGLVFHPEYGQAGSPNRGYFYVTYKWQPQGLAGPDYAYLRLSRFTVRDGQVVADASSELVLFQQLDRQQWHDAGCLMFGMDGYLYFSVGDEGGANDQYDVTQRLNERLMSGIFRIDVDRDATRSHAIRRQPFHHPDTPAGWPESFTANYYVPNDNPFVNVDGSVLEEYYAVGLRNPYRFSQDKVTGQIWVGDVGQDTREEVDILQAGANYQWPFGEGTINGPKSKPSPVLGTEKPPIWDYPHGSMGSCVIGGYVYRGSRLAELVGQYICVDNASGAVYAISNGGQPSQAVVRISTMPSGAVYGGTSSCGVDANGEIYFLKFGGDGAGGVYRLRQAQKNAEAPALLSQTGAFKDLAKLTPAAGLIPYSVNNPLWSDGAEKSRWIAIPNDGNANGPDAKIAFAPDHEWSFPEGTVFVKHFELGVDEKHPSSRKRVETRFLVLGQNNEAYGVTYRWRDDGSDADLLSTSATQDFTISTTSGGTRTQKWSFPAREDCTVCHNSNARTVLGFKTHQLNGSFVYPATQRTDNQLRALGHLGIFDGAFAEKDIGTYPKSHSFSEAGVNLETKSRSYLDSNCAHCHRPGGVRANFDARYTTPLDQQGLIYGTVDNSLNGQNGYVIKPHDLLNSMAHYRANRVGDLQMPQLAKNVVDANGIKVLGDWINSLAVGPGVTLSPTPSGVSGVMNVAVEFTENVTGLTARNFAVSGGTVKSLTGSGSRYTLAVTVGARATATVHMVAHSVKGVSRGYNYASNIVTLSSTLETYLPLDEGVGATANDASGNGNNGALTNMSNTNWTAGHTGKGLSFNGIDNYVAIKNSTGLDFTLACWIKTKQVFPVGDQTYEGTGILWADVGGAGNDFILGATQSGDGINRLSFFTGGGGDSTISGKTKINTGAWVNIAATRNGTTGERKIYVNGVLEAADVGGTGLLHDNPEIHLGGNTLDGRYFNGSIDGVRVYSEVLNAASIRALLTADVATTPASIAPVVVTGDATNITALGATFTGTVNPNSKATSVYFEYGLSTAYGNRTAVRTIPGGNSDVILAQPVASLGNGRTWHYRLIATSASGTSKGRDVMFTTLADLAAPPIDSIVSGTVVWPLDMAMPVSVSGLPSGLVYNPVTHIVSGAPNVSGNFTIKISADTLVGTVSQSFSLNVQPFPSSLIGTFGGLEERSTMVNDNLGGRIAFTISGTGMFTGQLYHGSLAPLTLSGRVAASLSNPPEINLSVRRSGTPPILLVLTFDGGTATFSGTASKGVSSAQISGRHVLSNPSALAASYNLRLAPSNAALVQPQGVGFMRAVVAKTGTTMISGRLGDGTPVTMSSQVLDDSSVPVWTSLYSGHGSISGSPIMSDGRPTSKQQWTGSLDWRKFSPVSATDHSYESFAMTTQVFGRDYTAPEKGVALLPTTSPPDNARIDFTGAGILDWSNGSTASQTFTFTTAQLALFHLPSKNTNGTSLKIDPVTGLFSGGYQLHNGATLRKVTFSGIFVSGEPSAQGWFTLPQLPLSNSSSILSGRVEIKGN